MAQTTHVSHRVMVSELVSRVAGAFHVTHDFLPALTIHWLHRQRLLLSRTAPVPQTCQTLKDPLVDVSFQVLPVDHSLHDFVGLIIRPVRPKNSDVGLEKTPSFPSHMRCGISVRDHRDPNLPAFVQA